MTFKAKDIAALIGGKIEGDGERTISSFSKIEEATPESLTFYHNPKYAQYLASTQAGILLVSNDFNEKVPSTTTLIRVENPYNSLAQLLQIYQNTIHPHGIETPSFIAPTAKIGQNTYIGAFSYIAENAEIEDGAIIYPHSYIGKNVRIGQNTVIYSGVKIYHDTQIGQNCIIHSGAVVGSDGFGFAPNAQGEYDKIPQVGNVIIENNVEIGANTTVDRATMGATHIMQGAKIDNLVQIAHNVRIGQNTVIAAQAGISGSTQIGKNVMIGGQAGIVGHISIADKSKINAQSGVSKSILNKGSAVTGSPAGEYNQMLRAQVIFKKLPEIWKYIQDNKSNL